MGASCAAAARVTLPGLPTLRATRTFVGDETRNSLPRFGELRCNSRATASNARLTLSSDCIVTSTVRRRQDACQTSARRQAEWPLRAGVQLAPARWSDIQHRRGDSGACAVGCAEV